MRIECESSTPTSRPLFKERMAGHRWRRPATTASDRRRRMGPLAVGKGPTDPRVWPNPRWLTQLTARAHCPSNGHMLFKLLVQAKLCFEKMFKFIFQGIFMLRNIFLDFCERKKSARNVSSMQGCFENSNMQWEKSKKSRKAKWWRVNMRYVPIYLR